MCSKIDELLNKKKDRHKDDLVFQVTPIVGVLNPEIVEELRILYNIKLYMDDIVKAKTLKREKSDIVQRRRK